MMQVNIMIPLFTVPQGAAHQKIIEQVIKLTGFEQVKLFTIASYPQKQFQKKQSQPAEGVKKLVVEIADLKLTISQLWVITQKYKQLQRQNNMLRRDLADFYERYQQDIIKNKLKVTKQQKVQQIKSQKTQDNKKIEKTIENKSEQFFENNFEDIEEFQKQIRQLVCQKRSKQEIIQKLTLYCECLLKIIEQKKISIF